jgi:hypothetical protein
VGDSWEKLAQTEYASPEAAAALREFNRNYPRAEGQIRATGTIAQGEKVFLPPWNVLQKYDPKLGTATSTRTGPGNGMGAR